MSKVVVFGSMNMDLSIACDRVPQVGETLEGFGFICNPGGKGANQAVASSRLGAPTVMIAAVGNDSFGSHLLEGLSDSRVSCARVRSLSDTTTGVAVIVRTHGDNRIILDPGANHALSFDDVGPLMRDVLEPDDVFVCQLECALDTTYSAIRLAHELGARVIFNPAPARVFPDDLWECIDLICLNETECEIITGILPSDDDSCRNVLKVLKERGASEAVLTLGSSGSAALCDDALLRKAPLAIEAVDSTGAGDTYIGAFAVALLEGKDLEACMDFATKASAYTCLSAGAQQAIAWRSDLDAWDAPEPRKL